MHLPINIQTLLHSNVVESDRIEFKSGWNPEPVLRSICAFANDFHNYGGGYIIIGVEEISGCPMLPPKGITKSEIDKMQKDLVKICSFLKPVYTPITSIESYQGKLLFVIWIAGGHARPYSAPRTLGKSKEYNFYIRKGSSTVIAQRSEIKELLEISTTTPFDDRINNGATLQDINLSLIQEFLKNVNSRLLDESHRLSLIDICRQMALVEGGNENVKPRNIALLFFNMQPDKFFPYAQIDVVHFPEGVAGNVIEERIFKGPIHHQLTEALCYIRNTVIKEKIIKIPGQAEAVRFFNYPYEAIEEALVNAVYHKSYEIREPIEVRINPDRIEILSHPGPDASIRDDALRKRLIISRRYRNRRVGEYIKELQFTEGRGTGIPKIYDALVSNGSPPPIIVTDETRACFLFQLMIHPEINTNVN